MKIEFLDLILDPCIHIYSGNKFFSIITQSAMIPELFTFVPFRVLYNAHRLRTAQEFI